MARELVRIRDLSNAPIEELLSSSEFEGFRMIHRLIDEYASGVNRFDGLGECLFSLWEDARPVAIGGLNRWNPATTARIRRFYVLPEKRRRGVGAELLSHLKHAASCEFTDLVLRTDQSGAALFYESQGFVPVNGLEGVTHRFELGRTAPG